MSTVPDKNLFQQMYTGRPPWDIDGPQKSFVTVADKISGSVLDAGCGTGENALYFAGRGCQLTGIDFVEAAIHQAQRKATDRGVSARFVLQDALQLTSIPDRFDNIIDSGLFHCFSDADRAQYVKGLATVLKPDGQLFVLCFSDKEPGTQGPRRVSKQELHEAFAHGWTIESIAPIHFEVRLDFTEMQFSEGGPHGWFVIVRRTGG